MKKIITIIAVIAFTATATAQVKFGVRGGYTLSPVSKSIHTDRYENQAHSESASSCGSAYAGLTAEVSASEKMVLRYRTYLYQSSNHRRRKYYVAQYQFAYCSEIRYFGLPT